MAATEPEVIRTPYDDEPDHNYPYECINCGAGEFSATSNSGCRNCGSQDEIVPRGSVLARRRRQWLMSHGLDPNTPLAPPLTADDLDIDRTKSFDEDRQELVDVIAQISRLRELATKLHTRLIVDCDHEGFVVQADWVGKFMREHRSNRLCLRCGLDLMNTGSSYVVRARQVSHSLKDVSYTAIRRVDEKELFAARNKFPQPLPIPEDVAT